MRSKGRLLFVGWIVWACFVLSHYYVQLLRAIGTRRPPSLAHVIAAGLPVLILAGGAVILRMGHLRTVAAAASRPGRVPPWAGSAAGVVVACAALFTVPWFFVWPQLAATLSRISAPGLPSLGEAAARLLVAATGASLVGAATVSAGAIVLRIFKCRFSSRIEQLVFAAVSGVAVISYSSLLLALLGIFRPLTVAVVISVALAAGVPGARRFAAGMAGMPILRRPDRRSAPWLALIVVALGYGLVAALAPEKEYDALWYHLSLPRLWFDAGHPVDLLEEYVSLYPLTWELMFAAGMTLGGVVGAKLLHFACLPLLGLVVWRGARGFFPGISAAAAVAFVVTTPTVLWESSTAYVDLALAAHAAAACYALAQYAEQGERPWRAVAALQFGLAAATKHLGVVLMLVALTLYVCWAMRSRRSIRTVARHALAISLAAVLLASPWYARSWLASGNPVFPEMFGVFGASPPERWDALTEQGLARFKARFGEGRSAVSLLTLPWDVTVHGAVFGGSLGPLFLILIPGFVCAGRVRRGAPWLAAGVVGYAAVWASPISSYQLRFLVPIVPALALLAAASLSSLTERAAESTHRGSSILAAAVLILGVMNLPPFTRFHEADRQGWTGWLTHVLRDPPVRVVIGREPERAYLAREVPSFEAWQWINTHVPADARVLTTTGGDQLYSHRARISYDTVIARPAVWVGSEELGTATAALRRLAITHVLFERRELSRLAADSRVLASSGFQQACPSEYADPKFLLCRVDYSRLPQ